MKARNILFIVGAVSLIGACSKIENPIQSEDETPVQENKQEIAVPQIMTKAAVDVASCQFVFYKPDGSGGFTETESLIATYSEAESKWKWAYESTVSEGVTKMVAILRQDVFNLWGWNSIWLKDLYEGDGTFTKSIYDNGIMVGVADFDHTTTSSITVYQILSKLKITLDESADFPVQTDFYMVKDAGLKINDFSAENPIDIGGQSKVWHVYTSKYDKADIYDVKNSISLPILPQTLDNSNPLFEYTKSSNRFTNSAYPDAAAPVRYSYKWKETIEVKKNRVLAITADDLVVTQTPYVLKTAAEAVTGTTLPYNDYFTDVAVNDVIRLTMTVPKTAWVQPKFSVGGNDLPDYSWNGGFNGTAGKSEAIDIVVNNKIYDDLTKDGSTGLKIEGDLTAVSIEIWTPKAVE